VSVEETGHRFVVLRAEGASFRSVCGCGWRSFPRPVEEAMEALDDHLRYGGGAGR
jgi:hypothetical protein